MRKRILSALALAGALLFAGSAARAQTQTNVTATVLDPIGIPYANGTYSVQLIPTGTNPTVNGQGIGGAFNGRLDANGSFNISLWPNASILPAASTWQFTICISPGVAPPLGTGGQCTPPTAVTIAGATQSLSATLSAVAPALTTISLGTGSVTSVSGTAPIVATPNPITGVGAISCPTCNTSSASISGTIAATQVAFGTALDTIGGSNTMTFDPLLTGLTLASPTITDPVASTGFFGLSATVHFTVSPGAMISAGASNVGELFASADAGATVAGGAVASSAGVHESGAGTFNLVEGFSGSVSIMGNVVESVGLFGQSSQDGTGTVGTLIGVLGTTSITAGSVTDAFAFDAVPTTSGSPTRGVGYHCQDYGNSLTQFCLYSEGGLSQLNTGMGQTVPVLDINNASSDTPEGELSVRGLGLGASILTGGGVLAHLQQEDNTTVALQVEEHGLAGAYFEEFWQNNGNYYFTATADNDTTESTIALEAGGNIALLPNGTGNATVSIGTIGFTVIAQTGDLTAPTFNTTTNCADSAGAAACGSAAAGSFVIDAAASTVVVSTTAVTANSEVFVQYDSSLGTRLGVTCNVTVALPSVTARTAATSFTVTVPAAPVTNPACYSYHIVN